MDMLFIQQDVFRNYGVMLLAAVIKKGGHRFDILIESMEKDIMKEIKRINPDIIGFSITTTRYAWMVDLARRIKRELNKLILVGGPHPTFFPEMIKESSVDIVCMGEGEYAILELLDRMQRKDDITRIPNLWLKHGIKTYKNPLRNLVEDLDSLPYADRKIYDKYSLLKGDKVGAFMSGRGCPYRCTFCFNKGYNEIYSGKGKILRRRSPPSMMKEIKEVLASNKRINYIFFYDDTFILGQKKWFREFLTRYQDEVGLPFSATARADLVNEDIIRMMRKAGCNSIRMGIESANPDIREQILRKGITNEQIIRSAEIIKRHNIKLQVYNILGAPGETLETALETYEMSHNIHPIHAWCSLMHPYPGTEIMEIAKQKGLIREDYDINDLDHSFFNATPLKMGNKKEIENLQKLFQFGNVFRIPKSVMRFLIKLPPNPLYTLIFRAHYALGIKSMENLSWSYLIKVALYSGNYFKSKPAEQKKQAAKR